VEQKNHPKTAALVLGNSIKVFEIGEVIQLRAERKEFSKRIRIIIIHEGHMISLHLIRNPVCGCVDHDDQIYGR